jgi:hypothetical protein
MPRHASARAEPGAGGRAGGGAGACDDALAARAAGRGRARPVRMEALVERARALTADTIGMQQGDMVAHAAALCSRGSTGHRPAEDRRASGSAQLQYSNSAAPRITVFPAPGAGQGPGMTKVQVVAVRRTQPWLRLGLRWRSRAARRSAGARRRGLTSAARPSRAVRPRRASRTEPRWLRRTSARRRRRAWRGASWHRGSPPPCRVAGGGRRTLRGVGCG